MGGWVGAGRGGGGRGSNGGGASSSGKTEATPVLPEAPREFRALQRYDGVMASLQRNFQPPAPESCMCVDTICCGSTVLCWVFTDPCNHRDTPSGVGSH